MADIHLEIPSGASANVPMKVNDNLYIEVTASCNWCFSDPDSIFSPELPACGPYNPETPPVEMGPYTATKTGSVLFNAVAQDKTCTLTGITATAHSIIVS